MSAFVERFWRSELGWPGRALATALAPAELAYRAAIRLRNTSYSSGVRAATIIELDVPVISVGSLLVGGAGKTPFTRWLVEYYASRGAQPGVLHGGYAADEPQLHKLWNPDVPVVAERDRIMGAHEAVSEGADALILDDGFQHRRLARNVDIVLVPVESWDAHPHLLPRGPWRESPAALQRATIIVLMHRGAGSADVARVRAEVASVAKQIPIIGASLLPTRWRAWKTGAHESPRSGIASAAIANPEGFFDDARRAGGVFDKTFRFRDHHDYNRRDLEAIRIAANGRPVLTTEKDAVKLGALGRDLELFVLEQELVFDDGKAVLTEMLDRVLPS